MYNGAYQDVDHIDVEEKIITVPVSLSYDQVVYNVVRGEYQQQHSNYNYDDLDNLNNVLFRIAKGLLFSLFRENFFK